MQVCWIASYPRSGNTWMRLLLHDVLYGPVESSTALQRRIPDLHRPMEDVVVERKRLLIKTHRTLSRDHPYFTLTSGFVYLIRDPRDVLLSAMDYTALSAGEIADRHAFALDYIRLGGLRGWIERGFGRWGEHARSWLAPSSVPRIVVRYEDLRADTAGELARVLGFLNASPAEGAIEGAVERNRLDRLQRKEDEEKRANACWFPGSAEDAERGRRFFNKGLTGQRLDTIAPGLDRAFDQRFGEDLRALGYGPVADRRAGDLSAAAG